MLYKLVGEVFRDECCALSKKGDEADDKAEGKTKPPERSVHALSNEAEIFRNAHRPTARFQK